MELEGVLPNPQQPVPILNQISSVHERGFFHFSGIFLSTHFHGMKHLVIEYCE